VLQLANDHLDRPDDRPDVGGSVARVSGWAKNDHTAVETIGANAMTSSPRGDVIREVAQLLETLQHGTPDLDTVLGELTESPVVARQLLEIERRGR
jgi:hypothetical protein